MNKVILTGKIHKIYQPNPSVAFATIHCKDSKNSEFIDVTIFQTTFFNRYFCEGMWVSVSGRIHKNKNQNYKQEIIVEQINFCGDVPLTDQPATQLPRSAQLPQPTQGEFTDYTTPEGNNPFDI